MHLWYCGWLKTWYRDLRCLTLFFFLWLRFIWCWFHERHWIKLCVRKFLDVYLLWLRGFTRSNHAIWIKHVDHVANTRGRRICVAIHIPFVHELISRAQTRSE